MVDRDECTVGIRRRLHGAWGSRGATRVGSSWTAKPNKFMDKSRAPTGQSPVSGPILSGALRH